MRIRFLLVAGLAVAFAAHWPASGAVQIISMAPSVASPQPLGTIVTWVVTATNTDSNPVAFQFSVGALLKPLSVIVDFNQGTLASGVWTSQPFAWGTIDVEGTHQVQVVAKDFTSRESASQTVNFTLSSLLTGGQAVVNRTANPLVALFSAPSCPAGSSMRVTFGPSASTPTSATNWKPCYPHASMNFYIAGMYPSTTYAMHYVIRTGGSVVAVGATLYFTTGALPSNITFPTFSATIPPGAQTDVAQSVLVHSMAATQPPNFPVATDLYGQILWYYPAPRSALLTRPLGPTMLSIQSGPAWNSFTMNAQLLREFDLAGNIVRETNTGIIQHQLVAMGANNGGSCMSIPNPPPIGAACLSNFSHEVIRLPNGYTVTMANVEKIFPAGTQGNTSDLPVDIVGAMVMVLDTNWQVVWYWDAFQHDSGGTQLDINRRAVLGETCVSLQNFCGPIFLVSSATAPAANEWLHENSIYYVPSTGDLMVSLRHQDWVIKIDYKNGTGSGNILWRMGPDGDFTFNNKYGDPWPWFSHQHDFSIENGGSGPITVFDNGNTRIAAPPFGLGSGNSRGMALTMDENQMVVTPVLSQDLGVFGTAFGSAQLLSNGSYAFLPGLVNHLNSFDPEVLPPTGGTDASTIIYNLQGGIQYRSFRMADLYHPPVT